MTLRRPVPRNRSNSMFFIKYDRLGGLASGRFSFFQRGKRGGLFSIILKS